MHVNEQLIHSFYTAFQRKDFEAMNACYANTATFFDPVFLDLTAPQVRGMWEMFCKNGKELNIDFKILSYDEYSGEAEWIATYLFSATGRKVTNRITAHFTFENSLIVHHSDSFSFYKWSRQALGATGLLLGWTSFLQNKVRANAMQSLARFIAKKSS